MGVMGVGRLVKGRGVFVCVVVGWDGVRILGQGLSAGLLIWREGGV